MKLSFHTDDPKYPDGYWYAATDDGGYDAQGSDPLTAVTNLRMFLRVRSKKVPTCNSRVKHLL